MLSKFITSNTASSSNSGILPSQTVTNPHEHVNVITTRSGKTCEGPSTPLPTPVVSTPLKEPEQNLETSKDKVQKPSLESIAQVPPLKEEDSIFIEILKPKAKKTIQEPNSLEPSSYQPKLPYPERMKDWIERCSVEKCRNSTNVKLVAKNKDACYNFVLSKLEEIAITIVNAECSTIIMNKVPEKLEDPRKFLIPCTLQELDRISTLADSGASIDLLPHSIYKQLGLEALTPTRMTLELANRSITHPMGIAEDVVVRVDGFTFLADFVVVNFEPDPRVPIILGRPFLRTAKALIDLYEEKLTLRVGSDELVFYAEKSEKSKNKQFAHAISVIDFSKDEPFSGSTTNHSDTLPPSSSPVKTSDNLEEFADELTPLKKDVHFQVYSNPLFEFDDNFTSSNVNPLFNEMDVDVENKNSNVSDSDEPVLLNTPLSNKDECFAPEDDIDEIDAFLAMEVSSNFEEGYFDSEGDVTFLDNLLSDDTTHNLAPEVISDHELEQNESSITFSPKSDPLHHEFAGKLLTLPSRNDHEHEDYLSRMTLLCEISTSWSHENVHANQSSNSESLPVSPIPVEDSEPVQEEIDIFLVPDDLIPPGVENDDSEDEDNECPNLDHRDDPSIPRPPPDVEKCLERQSIQPSPIDDDPFQMGTTREIIDEGTEGPINLGPERPRVLFGAVTRGEGQLGQEVEDALGRLGTDKGRPIILIINESTLTISSTKHSADTAQSDPGEYSPTEKPNREPNQHNLALLTVIVQNVQGRQNRGQGNNARGAGAVGYGRAQNRVGNANPGQARQGNVDEEQSLFLAGGLDNAIDEDVDEQPAHDHYQDAVCDHHEEHEMHDDVRPNHVVDSHADYTSDSNMTSYDQYVKDNAVPVVQNNASMVPNDAYEQVELYERRARFELTEREQKIDEQLRIVICDRNIKEENLKKELHSIKLQLASTIQHNKLMVDEVTSLKKDFNQKENKFLEEFLDLKALKDKVEDKLFKQGQSIQTVHMMCKPRSFYDEVNKVAIGYKNPLCLHRARQVQPALYSGHVIVTPNHAPAVVRDCEETLEQSEISRKKMHDKMKAKACVDNKVNFTPPNYSKENFLATFSPQKPRLTPEQFILRSQDIVKMNAEALKEAEHQTIKALDTVYPPNTPCKRCPRVLQQSQG
ncbi:retrovirus-related pol polyprotein from transposon TNT 1-94 [Tanacetum coccineum]